MDDNPWGDDPSPVPTPAKPASPPLHPVQTTSDLHSPPAVSSPFAEEFEEEHASPLVGQAEARTSNDTPRDSVVGASTTGVVGLGLEREDRIGGEGSKEAVEQEKEERASLEAEEEKATAPPTSTTSTSMPLAPPSTTFELDQDAGPPMDDFSDDEPTTSDANAAVGDAFDDDDFDDFGEAAGAGEGGDDDDFGDFGGDDDGFGTASPIPTPAASVPVVPVASTSGLPPLRLDLSNASKDALAPQLSNFLASLYPMADQAVSEEPEREVEGIGQVLVSESSRGLLSTLSSLPPLRPLDWKRSKIRREHLITLGVPINLDDSAESKPLASLVLPPVRASSPIRSPSIGSPLRASAPAGSLSPLPFTSSPHPSRPSTPSEDRRRQAAVPPPLDRARAKEIVNLQVGDLTLMRLGDLKKLKEEIEKISIEASEVLTHALLMREKEVGDSETYNGMIQDLVSAAARVKTTSASLSRSGSGRGGGSMWGRKSTGSSTSAVR